MSLISHTLRQPIIRVYFYDPQNDEEGFVNKLVASMDPPFCHVEFQVPSGKACSIYMKRNVHFRHRTFSNPAYTCLYVHCSQEQIDGAEITIQNIMQQDLQFSTTAMLGAHYGIDLCPEGHTFCSKVVCDILQTVHILPETLNCNVISPSKLYQILLEMPSVEIPEHESTSQLCQVEYEDEPLLDNNLNPIDWKPLHENITTTLSFSRRAGSKTST